tara:strand:+ start:2256 stop:3413 length:1158 start_codon:yes stop_codon:yes gene_type:complete
MIVVNKMEDVINISTNNEEYSIPYCDIKFAQLMKISEKAQEISSMEDYKLLLEDLEAILKEGEMEKAESFHPDVYRCPKTNGYYLKIKTGVISSVAMPKPLVRRLEESVDKAIDISPLLKCWMRFLRNKKAKNENFANRFFNYIDMKYQHPKIYNDKLEAGYSEEVAKKMAEVFQVKITNEGLINCYKVSSEVDWTYKADEEGNPVRKPLYQKTFDPVTGEVTGDSREGLTAEERTFIPAIMGTTGDSFYCEGDLVNKSGHIIKVGHVHRLPSWDYVNCNDNTSCVPGLHVGGLHYIAYITGEIHNVFVDPMHIGAIPNDDTGAMRVLQYFVHSSMTAVNGAIYHSSKYAEKTEEDWGDMKSEILKEFGELKDSKSKEEEEINAL